MSYQVLARKWRPKNFKELMGQEHVVTVLVNALEQQRLHHAYLFTGTRGVGKTTIARIFAKSLNCQIGITSQPCGTCNTCLDIDLGRFVDLIEIDAASKTKVDDTREILDNVQYAPTSGRYKVYLIDEVHMLSRSSFNALLKTLEEPPEHVKFILATTDPQKLPVTVLSRCLQFHLKALTVNQIEQQLELILQAENVKADKGSVTLLAKAARGSMRDSLSLTDQSIAQGAGEITLSNVQKMLGGVDQNWVYKLMIALIKQDPQQLMTLSLNIASYSPSYSQLLAELIQLLHQVAMVQIVERHFDLPPEHELLLKKFAKAMSPEDVQLYYQIALNGRKDLPYAADEQAAFDMVLLRLLAFKPVTHVNEINSSEALPENECVADFDDSSLVDTLEKEESEKPVKAHIQQVTDNDMAYEKASELDDSTNDFSFDTNQNYTNEYTNEYANEHTVKNTLENIIENTSTTHNTEITHQQGSINTQPLPNKNIDEEQGRYSQNHQVDVQQPSIQHTEPPQFKSDNTDTHQAQLHQAPNVNQTNFEQEPLPEAVLETVTYSSPIESALATRNILRSRKKQMEQKVKKSNDVEGRHTSTATNVKYSTNEASESFAQTPTSDSQSQAPINMVTDEPYREEMIDPTTIKSANQVDKWANMIDSMALSARIRQIAIHATISESSTDEHLILLLDQSTKHLKTDTAVEQLQQSISNFLSKSVNVEVIVVEKTQADPYKIQVDINDKRYQYAVNLLKEDNIVQGLQQHFQAQLNEKTIQAL